MKGLKKYRLSQPKRFIPLVIVVISLAAIGTYLLVSSHAATTSPYTSVETESGSLTSPAAAVNDSAASGGKAVDFGASSNSGGGTGTVVSVSTAAQLTAALAAAQPGQTIKLADGTYSGEFNSTASGTSSQPITLTGSRNAVIDGGSLTKGYTFSLGTKDSSSSVSYWKLEGFTVTGGQKGVVLDNVQNSVVDSLYIHEIGEEGLHLRDFSSNNTVSNNTITLTGQDQEAYGEGIYVGSAVSNWKTYSQGVADHSNNNQLIGNNISETGAENMDIKEGTHNGVISNNHFDGTGMCYDTTANCNYADSWIDMKGNDWQVTNNIGVHMNAVWDGGGQTDDGFQDHVISGTGSEGSGDGNTFAGNSVDDVAGYGFNIQSSATGVVVSCSNTVTAAGKGFGNVTCTP